MFNLTQSDLKLRIVGCADGPASFNAEATRIGTEVVSIDPLYRFSRSEIRCRIQATYPEMLKQTRANESAFVWKEFASVDELGRARMASMERFLGDYVAGLKCGRYRFAELPSLPLDDQSFELALCSHFLFLYTDQFSQKFHVDSILEMCRVASEARIFPLLGLGGTPSNYVVPIIETLQTRGYRVSTETVEYEFQRGGNQMLRIRNATRSRLVGSSPFAPRT